MSTLPIVIFFSLIGSLISLAGGFILLANKKRAQSLIKYITPFAGGALLAAAFMDILTEAEHGGYIAQALQWTLAGILIFLVIERFVQWFHARSDKETERSSTIPLIIIGDTMHNFLDGIAIAAAFLIDIPTGIITTIAVAAHEIPQEVGDFGLLLDKGMKRKNVIKANIVSALATTLAAVIFFQLGHEFGVSSGIALGLVAGFFIYIAVSDIIPAINSNKNHKQASIQIAMLIIGVILVSFTTTTLHKYIDNEHHEAESSSQNHDEHGH